ncbi:hypothetical protein BCR44DRAFT_121781 [Catenaria anguillulae PL171]|uniref:Dpy-30 motif-domain-containing protein n=1 Tax=Catenaria anguillulae PL171 TaxID=765915 RepID=A0A1Y2HE50_9FUNG|nr:hypothetical protein BCR44DRAFT_121781 [Catenaria anguillulae PL171]
MQVDPTGQQPLGDRPLTSQQPNESHPFGVEIRTVDVRICLCLIIALDVLNRKSTLWNAHWLCTVLFSQELFEQEKRALLDANRDFLQGMPVRSYLDQTVVPLILEGMKALVRERPPNPCEYLGLFLIKNASRVDKPLTTPLTATSQTATGAFSAAPSGAAGGMAGAQ